MEVLGVLCTGLFVLALLYALLALLCAMLAWKRRRD